MNYALSLNGQIIPIKHAKSQHDYHLRRQQLNKTKQGSTQKSELCLLPSELPIPTRPSSVRSRRLLSGKHGDRKLNDTSREFNPQTNKSQTLYFKRPQTSPNFPFNLNYTLGQLKKPLPPKTISLEMHAEPARDFKNRVYRQKKCDPQRRFYFDCICYKDSCTFLEI